MGLRGDIAAAGGDDRPEMDTESSALLGELMKVDVADLSQDERAFLW